MPPVHRTVELFDVAPGELVEVPPVEADATAPVIPPVEALTPRRIDCPLCGWTLQVARSWTAWTCGRCGLVTWEE